MKESGSEPFEFTPFQQGECDTMGCSSAEHGARCTFGARCRVDQALPRQLASTLTHAALKESVEWFVENYDKGARVGKHPTTNGV
jgi:hypothetical protein